LKRFERNSKSREGLHIDWYFDADLVIENVHSPPCFSIASIWIAASDILSMSLTGNVNRNRRLWLNRARGLVVPTITALLCFLSTVVTPWNKLGGE
jgi:hypothetical protein